MACISFSLCRSAHSTKKPSPLPIHSLTMLFIFSVTRVAMRLSVSQSVSLITLEPQTPLGCKLLSDRTCAVLLQHAASARHTGGQELWTRNQCPTLNYNSLLLLFSCWVVSDAFVTPRTVAHQASLFIGTVQERIAERAAISFSGDLLNPGIEPTSPALGGRFFTTEPPGKPAITLTQTLFR